MNTNRLRIVLLIMFFMPFYGCRDNFRKVCLNEVCLQAEVADSRPRQSIGLMFRESLPDGQAMLFIFEKEDLHSFWMKNMRFPLDIIWINGKKEIVDLKTGVLPCLEDCESLIPAAEASYVLEVNSGFVLRNGIRIGQRVKF